MRNTLATVARVRRHHRRIAARVAALFIALPLVASSLSATPATGPRIRIRPMPDAIGIFDPAWPRDVFVYRLPEYVIPNDDRGSFTPNMPRVSAEGDTIILTGVATSPHPAAYTIVVYPGEDVIDFDMTVTNTGPLPWKTSAYCVLCLRFNASPTFYDAHMDRTFIRMGERFVAIADTKAHERHFAHLLRPDDPEIPSNHTTEDPATCSLIIRSSADGRHHVGLAWDDAVSVSHNLNEEFNCIHSNPRFGALQPGESRTLHGKLYFADGSREMLFERYKKNFPHLGYGEPSSK
jgi:hypothetical protein